MDMEGEEKFDRKEYINYLETSIIDIKNKIWKKETEIQLIESMIEDLRNRKLKAEKGLKELKAEKKKLEDDLNLNKEYQK